MTAPWRLSHRRRSEGERGGRAKREARSLVAAFNPVLALAALAVACSGAPEPAPLDTNNDACARCRMAVSDRRFAAQLLAPGEEPLFFDDIGCLRDYLKALPALPRGAMAYVADHRSGEWVDAARAIYSVSDSLRTPMASGLVAHADAASRDEDEAAKGSRNVPPAEVLGPLAPGRGPGSEL
ncbi:MAG: hypothetical protein ACE148_08210 [Vicinamibacterales bacterium]